MRTVRSGSPYEAEYGFSRAVQVGDTVHVSGTAPIWPDGSCDPDAEVQADRCFAIIAEALAELGTDLGAVVRTRLYLTDPTDAAAVGRSHHRAVGAVAPAATMVVVATLVDPRWRVEVEVDAVVRDVHPGEPA